MKASSQPKSGLVVEFPAQGTIHDIAGHPVDANGWTWTLHHPVSRRGHLDFTKLGIVSPAFLRATVLFIASRIQVSSIDDVRNAFEALSHLHLSEHFRATEASGGTLDEALFADLRNGKSLAVWRLHHIRMWYRWCAGEFLPGFSESVANALDEITIGGNEKGVAVLTRDPIQGAFDELELTSLRIKPTDRKAFVESRLATVHMTDIGACIQDWSLAPCAKHGSCASCSEHLVIKGDAKQRGRAEQLLKDYEPLLAETEREQQDGTYGAAPWMEHNRKMVDGLKRVIAVHDDASIPDGTPVQSADRDIHGAKAGSAVSSAASSSSGATASASGSRPK